MKHQLQHNLLYVITQCYMLPNTGEHAAP